MSDEAPDRNAPWLLLLALPGAPADETDRRRAMAAWRGATAGMATEHLIAAAEVWPGDYPTVGDFLEHASAVARARSAASAPKRESARQERLPSGARVSKDEARRRISAMRTALAEKARPA